MSGNGLERDLAADLPLSDEDAAAVVGGAIVKLYKLPGNVDDHGGQAGGRRRHELHLQERNQDGDHGRRPGHGASGGPDVGSALDVHGAPTSTEARTRERLCRLADTRLLWPKVGSRSSSAEGALPSRSGGCVMSENELERDLAADMPLSDEDAAAVVGGAIVKTYNLAEQPDGHGRPEDSPERRQHLHVQVRNDRRVRGDSQGQGDRGGQEWIPDVVGPQPVPAMEAQMFGGLH